MQAAPGPGEGSVEPPEPCTRRPWDTRRFLKKTRGLRRGGVGGQEYPLPALVSSWAEPAGEGPVSVCGRDPVPCPAQPAVLLPGEGTGTHGARLGSPVLPQTLQPDLFLQTMHLDGRVGQAKES